MTTIGDFRGPANNPLRTKPPEDNVTHENAQVSEKESTLVPETPIELYKQRLALAGIDENTARSIYDAVLTQGYYEEYVSLSKTRRAVLRTRTYEDTLRLQRELEMLKPEILQTQQDIVTRFNLAASLYEWDHKELAHNNEDDFNKIHSIIKKLPQPIFSLLSQKIAAFDAKTMLVFSEGAADFFC